MDQTRVKKIGLLACSGIVAGNMMGSGVSLLPSSLASIGSITIISWFLAIIGALSLAYIFAKLGTDNPQEGGPIAYSEEVAPILGYQAGVLYFHANWIGNLAIAITGVAYLSVFFPILTHPLAAGFATIGVVWIFAIINLLGAHWVGRLTAIGVVLLLIPIVLTGAAGFFFFKPDIFVANWNVSPKGDFHAIVGGVLLCLWSFIGVESATTDASLVENPKRNIPRATLIGSGVAALVYVVSCTAISGMFPAKEVAASGAPFSLAVAHIVGPWSAHIVSALVAFGCLTSLASWMMLVAQAGARTAHDGMLPAIFGKISARNIPTAGVLLTATLMTVLMGIMMIFSKQKSAQVLFSDIISIAVLLTIIPYFYSTLCLIKNITEQRKKVFFQVAASFLSVGFCLVAIAGAQDEILVATVAASFIAMVFYERKDRSLFEKKVFDMLKGRTGVH